MTVKLESPSLDDVAALAGLKARTFVEAFGADNDPAELAAHIAGRFSVEAVAQQLEDPDATTRWLLEGDAPVGYLKVNRGAAQTEAGLDDGLELEQIYVLQSHHGRGLGGRLLRHAIELARAHEVAFVWLSVWEHNANAISLYRHHGFAEFDEHIFLLGNEEQRDLLMRLDL